MSNTAQILPEIHLDEYGLLKDPSLWSKEVAMVIANDLGVSPLGSHHWKVIHSLRQHFSRFGAAPAMHNICHSAHKSDIWIHDLFLNCLNAWRVAGLPDPGEEAKAYLNDM